MKRLALAVFASVLVLATAVPAAAMGPLEFNLLAGVDFDGKLKGGTDIDTANGYTLGLEVILDFPLIDVGAGAEYGFDRSVDDGTDNTDLNYYRIYAVGRVTLFSFVYVVGRYGYSEFDGIEGLDGGGSWSFGPGLNLLSKFRLEVLFNRASAEIEHVSFDYESYSARFIYSF